MRVVIFIYVFANNLNQCKHTNIYSRSSQEKADKY